MAIAGEATTPSTRLRCRATTAELRLTDYYFLIFDSKVFDSLIFDSRIDVDTTCRSPALFR
jgi:hypothetical protein